MKFIIIFFIFLFTGCTVTKPLVFEYRIVPKVKITTYKSTLCKKSSLKVRKVNSSSSLMSKKMKYAEDGYKEFSFSESAWAESPNKAISSQLVKSIKRTNIFSSVHGFKSYTKSKYILESNLEDFMQYFTDSDGKSYVIVSLDMALFDAETVKSLSSRNFTKRVEVMDLNAQGGVKALNLGLAVVLEETNKWLSEVCK
ncbi:ABC-type transport auxiliary lipoprotein family protein [Sulfurimonas sp.]|jgi:cholesterol transport system auxiliary component|uniref:ABC-type transport auxiliary lipoprotein family protein n=1 Tax=Sulfurimonas sp. TaxID=2022749 RepID=UPI0025E64645|nr:ABC-type transport auxiliary lipoprotein family protein [Sulfurimonas sp.]MBT5934498.1 hypothetical protein [Sulfurimonas sp.]